MRGPGSGRAAFSEDVEFMRRALREAERAFAEGEVPVGAVVVHEGPQGGCERLGSYRPQSSEAESPSRGSTRSHGRGMRCDPARLFPPSPAKRADRELMLISMGFKAGK